MRPIRWILGLSIVFFILFLGISFVLATKWNSKDKLTVQSGSALFKGASDGVGVIEIRGVIADSKKILKQLNDFEESDRVKAVVLRLDTPGGVVGPSQEIYQKVKAFPKPIVASMGSVAASGGYYIAAGAKKIYSNPGTITGSIGVILELVNLKKLYEWAKIERYAITSGKFKGSGAEYRELTKEERELYQGMIDDVLHQFRDAVKEGRGMSDAEVVAVSDGRIFSGAQGKKVKLVDELGSMEDAVNEAAKMAKIEGKPKLIYPEKDRKQWLDLMLNQAGDEEDSEARASDSLVSSITQGLFRGAVQAVGLNFPTSGLHTSLPPGMYVIWNGQR